MGKIEEKLNALGYTLPNVPPPVGNYISYRRVGNILYLGGVPPSINGVIQVRGKLGDTVSVEQGYYAARLCVLNHLAVIKKALGDLDNVEYIIQLKGYVSSAPGFGLQPEVINGASDLLVELFGDAGRHTRCALGMAELLQNISVELEMIVKVKESLKEP